MLYIHILYIYIYVIYIYNIYNCYIYMLYIYNFVNVVLYNNEKAQSIRTISLIHYTKFHVISKMFW